VQSSEKNQEHQPTNALNYSFPLSSSSFPLIIRDSNTNSSSQSALHEAFTGTFGMWCSFRWILKQRAITDIRIPLIQISVKISVKMLIDLFHRQPALHRSTASTSAKLQDDISFTSNDISTITPFLFLAF